MANNLISGGIFDGSNTQVSKRDTSFHKEELTVSTILVRFSVIVYEIESSFIECSFLYDKRRH